MNWNTELALLTDFFQKGMVSLLTYYFRRSAFIHWFMFYEKDVSFKLSKAILMDKPEWCPRKLFLQHFMNVTSKFPNVDKFKEHWSAVPGYSLLSTDAAFITLHHKGLICRKCWAQMIPIYQNRCKEGLEFQRWTRTKCREMDFTPSQGRPKVKDRTVEISSIEISCTVLATILSM